jgi:hypothetical protein
MSVFGYDSSLLDAVRRALFAAKRPPAAFNISALGASQQNGQAKPGRYITNV